MQIANSSRKRTIARAAAGSALAVAASLVVLPASAQAAYTCKAGQICLYEDYNLQGSVLIISNLGQHNFTSGWAFYNGDRANDNVSSIVNKSTWGALACRNFNCDGSSPKAAVLPGEQMNFRGNPGEIPNDTMSAIWVVG